MSSASRRRPAAVTAQIGVQAWREAAAHPDRGRRRLVEWQKLRCYTWEMTTSLSRLSTIPDHELLAEVARLAACEREATARLIASLVELDARRLYLGEGCSSLFTYCTRVLHLSEHAAYGRITAARAARRFPIVLELLEGGALTLTAVGLLAPHLTGANHRDLLAAARHRSKRDLEQLVARLRPRPDVSATIRKLPAPAVRPSAPTTESGQEDWAGLPNRSPDRPPAPVTSATGSARAAATASDSTSARAVMAPLPGVAPAGAPSPTSTAAETPVPDTRMRAAIIPLAPERFKVQFTVSRETHDKIRVAQDLLRHTVPSNDLAVVFERAIGLLLEQLSRRRLASAAKPRVGACQQPAGRHIPASVRREVWTRDGGRCAFVGSRGRCVETSLLEFHHVVPYAEGGSATAENIELRCRAHNAFEATAHFGPLVAREGNDSYSAVRTRSGPS